MPIFVESSKPAARATRRTVLRAGGALAAALAGGPWAGSRAADADLAKVTLRVGDQTSATQGLLKSAGLLDAVPYKIDWSSYAAAVNLHEALKADAIDIGGANDSPTVAAIAGGSKIVVATGWNNGGKGTSLLVRKDSGIRTLADLRGKTISPTTRGSVAHYLVVNLLKQAGIPPDAVKLAFLAPTDASAAFGSGSIAAWATWAIYRERAVGSLGARVLSDGVGINSGLFLLSATQSAVRDPGKLAAIAHFAGLLDQGYEWGRRNRERYIDWYAGFAKQDRSVVSGVYEENVAFRRVPADDALVARLKQTHAVWLENGVLSGAVDFNRYVFRELKSA